VPLLSCNVAGLVLHRPSFEDEPPLELLGAIEKVTTRYHPFYLKSNLLKFCAIHV
jgi:hypothetical protein